MPLLILAAITAIISGTAPVTSLNATLETSNGDRATLTSLITKNTVVFYEDRDSTKLNQHVKDALIERGRATGKLDAVSVVAIASVKEWNWFPARNFVLKAVRDIEAKVHIPIYLDFTGDMTQAPWNLSAKTSTVVVLSPQAQPIIQFKGRLSDEQVEKLFSTLEQLTAAPPETGETPEP